MDKTLDKTEEMEQNSPTNNESVDELPSEIIKRAETLTRQMRNAVDENERSAYLRERRRVLSEYGFRARVREDETGDVLVCYPVEWVDDGTIQPDRVEDISRGVERQLSGVGDDSWETVNSHNQTIVAEIEHEHGPTHAANAAALAEFAGNHYKKRIGELSNAELEVFLTEYYPRNVWPTDDQKAVVEESVQLVIERTERVI